MMCTANPCVRWCSAEAGWHGSAAARRRHGESQSIESVSPQVDGEINVTHSCASASRGALPAVAGGKHSNLAAPVRLVLQPQPTAHHLASYPETIFPLGLSDSLALITQHGAVSGLRRRKKSVAKSVSCFPVPTCKLVSAAAGGLQLCLGRRRPCRRCCRCAVGPPAVLRVSLRLQGPLSVLL